MSLAMWPPGLPQVQEADIKVAVTPPWAESDTDTGPKKRRLRGTKRMEKHTFSITLTGAQLAIFDVFFTETLVHGTLPFTWESALDDAPATYRFLGYPPYSQWTPALSSSDRQWTLPIELEVM